MGNSTIDHWHKLLNSRNPDGLDALLDDSVVFHSPILHRPQVGRELSTMYLTAAFHVLVNDSFCYVREIVGAHNAALEFVVEIDGVSINGVDLIQWNSVGRITDFKVMLRPLKAINLVQQKMLAMLQAGK